jgi:chemotaxis protein MotA
MDIASALGILLGIAILTHAVFLAPGSSPLSFLDPRSLAIVVGGSLAATLVCFPLGQFLGLFRLLRATLFRRPVDPDRVIDQMIELAETARKGGLLALEPQIAGIPDPLLALGLQMVVDGTRPEVVEDVLRMKIQTTTGQYRACKAIMDQMGRFAPAFGLIGTLIGLILMLGNMQRPERIAPGLSVALMTTFYGVVMANVICLPIAEKLGYLAKHQSQAAEIVLRGLLSIQAGEHPWTVEQRLGTLTSGREATTLPLRKAA